MSNEPTINEPEAAQEEPRTIGMTRRNLCLGVGGAVALVALGGVKYLGQQPAVRPPGGQDEARLLGACNRCGKCYEVCPHHIIQPQHLEDGIWGARSPYLSFTEEWCDWCADANNGKPLCVEVCPTKALELPANATPENTILGKVVLDTETCIAYRRMTECRWCYNACEYDAIELSSLLPKINADKCNGCGACEAVCISLEGTSISGGKGTRAIYVVPVEEA